MDLKRISLSEIRQAGVDRELLKVQVATRESLDVIKETSRVLCERTREMKAHSSTGRPFTVDWTVPGLPRAVPLRNSGRHLPSER